MTAEDFLNTRLGFAAFLVCSILVFRLLWWINEKMWESDAKLRAQLHKEQTGEDKPWQHFMPRD